MSAAPRRTSPPFAIAPMSTVTTHSTLTSSHSGSTQRHTATSLSSSSSVGAPIIDGAAGGPVASLDARAALFNRCAAQAMAAADEAAADAERIKRAVTANIEYLYIQNYGTDNDRIFEYTIFSRTLYSNLRVFWSFCVVLWSFCELFS